MASEQVTIDGNDTFEGVTFSAAGSQSGVEVYVQFDDATPSADLVAALDRAIAIVEQRFTELGA